MTRDEFDSICTVLPGAERGAPPRPDSWQVGGKIFAFFGTKDQKGGVSLHAGSAERAEAMLASGTATAAPYFKAPWVQLDIGDIETQTARGLVVTSYDTIRASLTKKAQAALPAREETA